MAYYYSSFSGVPLPTKQTVQDHSTPEFHNPLVQTTNGAYDYFGFDQRAFSRPHTFQVTGLYDDETIALAEGGDTIVDHNGNTITSSTADELIELLEALKAKSGSVGPLIRQIRDTSGRKERKFCRLLQVEYVDRSRDNALLAPATAVFSTLQPHWQSTTPSNVTQALSVGANSVTVNSSGNAPIYDAVLTFAITGSVTNIDISLGNNHLVYSGSLVNTDTLIIDCGNYSVTKNANPAYNDFALGSSHNDNVWLRLGASNSVDVTLTGGTATFDVDYYDQYL